MRVLLLAFPLVIAACSSPLPESRSQPADGGAQADADPLGLQAVAIETSANSLVLDLGGSATVDAWLVDADGSLVPSDAPVWSFDNDQLVSIDASGGLLAMRPGTTALTATIGSFSKALPITVANGDLSACCIDAGAVSSFCSAAVGTASCPMTLPGGYCDPDGDGAYDAMSDTSFGTSHYQSVCIDGCSDQGCGCGNPGPTEVCELVNTNNCHDVPISTTCSGGVAVACAPAVDVPTCTSGGINVGDTYPVGSGCTCTYQRQRKQVQQCSDQCI